MDGWALGFFLLAAFLGGLASGIAGFAMGFVVSGIWLHIITPIQTTTLIVGYGLWTQGYGVWKLRHTLKWRQVAPFIIGGAIGVPVGTMLLTSINPAYLRTGVGVLLVLYSIYGLAQPAFKPIKAGVPADAGIGVLNGLLAGVTGLPGLIVTIWSQLRGWPKDVQRTVFQPVMLAAIVMNAVTLAMGARRRRTRARAREQAPRLRGPQGRDQCTAVARPGGKSRTQDDSSGRPSS